MRSLSPLENRCVHVTSVQLGRRRIMHAAPCQTLVTQRQARGWYSDVQGFKLSDLVAHGSSPSLATVVGKVLERQHHNRTRRQDREEVAQDLRRASAVVGNQVRVCAGVDDQLGPCTLSATAGSEFMSHMYMCSCSPFSTSVVTASSACAHVTAAAGGDSVSNHHPEAPHRMPRTFTGMWVTVAGMLSASAPGSIAYTCLHLSRQACPTLSGARPSGCHGVGADEPEASVARPSSRAGPYVDDVPVAANVNAARA